jgi:PemK-like, MazF-like toxin of type II toxin-antitoxin system
LLLALIRWLLRLLGVGAQRLPPAQDTTPPDIVRVEYSPSRDGDPDPGEVVWTWIPYEEDPTQGKDRPVLLIGRRQGMLVGVSLTSKRHERDAQFNIGEGPWDNERRPSYVRLEHLHDIDATKVRREGAILDRQRFDAVINAVRQIHGRRIQ